MELLGDSDSKNRARASQSYYYIWAVVNGRLYVDWAYSNYNDALRFGANKIKVYFEVTELPTKDLSIATQAIKHQYLEKTGDIEQATKRAKHK